MSLQTLQFRIKDSSGCAVLTSMAMSINFVWNFCNSTQRISVYRGCGWPSGFDLCGLTSGCSKELGINAQTIQAVCEKYFLSRKNSHKRGLRWRSKRSLGWIPFKRDGIKICADCVVYYKQVFHFWKSREIPDNIRCGSFSQDSRGRWYLNIVCDTDVSKSTGTDHVGIDLGLKDFAVCSNGVKLEAPRWYRRLQGRIAKSQQKGKRRQTRNLHAKVKNQRKDWLHKASTSLVENSELIVVGDVSSSKLAKTSMAKSVLDAGWSMFRNFLKYKAIARGVVYIEVSEYLTTQTCFHCSAVNGPKGREGLGIREWVCGECGRTNDRDINSAMNILRLGHQSLNLK